MVIRRLFILFVLALAIFSFFYKKIDQPIEEFKPLIAVVHYTATNCSECKQLEHQLNQIAWVLGKKPVLFLDYSLQNHLSKQQTEQKLREFRVLETVQKNYQLREAHIIDLKTNHILGKIYPKDDPKTIERKIEVALQRK